MDHQGIVVCERSARPVVRPARVIRVRNEQLDHNKPIAVALVVGEICDFNLPIRSLIRDCAFDSVCYVREINEHNTSADAAFLEVLEFLWCL